MSIKLSNNINFVVTKLRSNMNELKKFKPITKPRILIEFDNLPLVKLDLKLYNRHLYNVFNAEAHVDCKPPHLGPQNYVNMKKIQLDAIRLQRIDIENKKLIAKINKINRMGGETDCWPSKRIVSPASKWENHVTNMQQLMKQNKNLYNRLMNVDSNYHRSEQLKDYDRLIAKMSTKFPIILFDKKSIDQRVKEQPSISSIGRIKGTRPKAFLDFSIDCVFLGRIIVELYKDVCPMAVENFLNLCSNLSYKNCRVHNSLRGKYFETGDITKGNGKGGKSFDGNPFDPENSLLKHSKTGVLSMIPSKDKKLTSVFSVTYNPTPELDDKRMVFGKVIKGNATLCKINDTSKRIGTPTEKVVISKCGVISKGSIKPTLDTSIHSIS